MPELPEQFAWDRFYNKALAAGVKESTALAGRALMRECDQHGWENYMGPDIRELCGWEDEGANMIAFGLAHPKTAEELWQFLEKDDAGNNPRSRTPKKLQPLIMQSFRDKKFPLDLSNLPSPLGSLPEMSGDQGTS